VVVVAVILLVVARFRNWGTKVDLKEVDDLETEIQGDSYDHIMPLTDENGYLVKQDVKRILVFGNSYFAEDRDSDQGMAALLAAGTGAEVINCAIADSTASAVSTEFDANLEPMDAFNPFWLVMDLYSGITYHYKDEAGDVLGYLPDGAEYAYDTLKDLDMSTVDVVVFMYDMTDYFLDRRYVDGDNHHNMTTYCGNIKACVDLIHETYPNVRIIVMSPTYAYYVNENGDYEDAELHRNSWGPASDYFLFLATLVSNESNASFVDNYFSSINVDNASYYLKDNMHVNQAGRQLLVDRLIYAINYYNK
jgi:hypothetical protein